MIKLLNYFRYYFPVTVIVNDIGMFRTYLDFSCAVELASGLVAEGNG